MKKLIIGLAVVAAIFGCNSMAQEEKDSSSNNSSDPSTDELSYAIGISIAENFKKQNLTDLNYSKIAEAMQDFEDGNATITGQQAQMTIQRIQMEQKKAKYATRLKASEDFLAENGKRDGVITTESGLQYEVIKEGSGERPTSKNRATVHYDGTLIDGTPFDSSRKKGKPFTFNCSGGVIKGWLEAVQLMTPGSIYKFYIHPDLGYGLNPRPGVIQPNDALVFEIELISFE